MFPNGTLFSKQAPTGTPPVGACHPCVEAPLELDDFAGLRTLGGVFDNEFHPLALF